ncbi:apolipoprotein N-acyltransferase [Betaproteobacteria bacterium SCN2]|nr:apolipoprotein N-acyltransferase [Betaproteobacteria bacterium SCN2]
MNWSSKLTQGRLAPAASAFILGGLAALAFAPVGWFLLIFLSLAGLLHLVDRASPRRAFLLGWLFGLGLFGVGVSWIYISLHVYGGMPAWLAGFAVFLFCGIFALFPALASWATARYSVPGRLRLLLVFPLMWTGVEWVRGWLFTGFPWLAAGYAQVPEGPLAGFAPIVGVYGVSWLSAFCAGALVWLLRSMWQPGRWLVPFAALLAVLGAGEGLKPVEWTTPVGKPVSVALVQGNVPQEMKWRPERVAQTLADYAAHVRAAQAELIVLPETAFPVFYQALPPAYLAELRALAAERGADILAGVPTGDLAGDYYNSVVSIGQGPPQFYHKHHLVAFGEFVPPGFGWIVRVLHIPLSDFARGGKDQPPIEVAGQKVALNICYEDVFGEEIVRALPEATLLVNVTNDAWFGKSFAGWQHAQMAQMRALEAGRYMLRSTNTGVTAIIDHKGRVLSSLPEFTTATLTGEAQGYEGMTPYARWGNAPVVLLLLGLLGVVALRVKP